jgi:hypothetical protein
MQKMGLRPALVVFLLALLGGTLAHASGAESAHLACPQASTEQCAEPRSADAQGAGTDCAMVCSASACIASWPAQFHFRIALARPCTLLAVQVTKHSRAPDTAPPRASFT